MSVIFKVSIDKTTGGYTTVYLWVYERLWWIFTVENIIKSERVPIGKAQDVAEKLLKDAEGWYKIYNNSPSGCMARRSFVQE
jgi:hypothetical protein